MLKFRPSFDKDKVCNWLNEMAQSGWALQKFGGGFFSFAPCTAGEYQYAIDVRSGGASSQVAYDALMEEQGLRVVSKWGPWIFLERKATGEPFTLYSDIDSEIDKQRRALHAFQLFCIVDYLCCLLSCGLITQDESSPMPYVLLAIAGLFCLIFLSRVRTIRRTIEELKIQRGDGTVGDERPTPFILPAGVLMAGCGSILGMSRPLGAFLMGFGLSIALCGFACGCFRRKRAQ